MPRPQRMRRSRTIYRNPPGGFALPPVHPGETLAGELAVREMSVRELARRLSVPPKRVSEIVSGKRGISPETALRLGRYFGTGATFWVNLQSHYDLATARQALGEKIESEVEGAA